MKAKASTIIAVLLAIVAAACTHNNGDIGPWFGAWKVEAITIDGEPKADYGGNLFFEFQSTVVKMCLVGDHHSTVNVIGNWDEDSGGVLHLNFPDPRHQPIAVTGLPADCRLSVKWNGSRHMTLEWANPDTGQTTVFSLKKWK